MATSETSPLRRRGFSINGKTVWFHLSPSHFVDYLIEINKLAVQNATVNNLGIGLTLCATSLLDPVRIEEADAFDSSLLSGLDRAIMTTNRGAMLWHVILHLVNDPGLAQMRKDAETLLDGMLKEAGVIAKPKLPMFHKSTLLAQQQMHIGLTRGPNRTDQNEIHIRLYKLINQDGGNIKQTNLYLAFATPWQTFLDILRDETMLCKPAENFTDTRRSGFTLDDGPWSYRLVKENRAIGYSGEDWSSIVDEWTYRDMIDGLKECEMAIIMHSSEAQIAENDAALQREKEEAKAQLAVVKDETGKPFFDEDDYLEYLMKTSLYSFTTSSSTKKRKICKSGAIGSNSNPEIPLESIENRENSHQPEHLPRLEFPDLQDPQSNLPPHIPSHLQNEASLLAQDHIPSAASSPSAACANLSIESERGGDNSGSESGTINGYLTGRDIRSQSPQRSFAHRRVMGGAADLPQRSSSPLKRRASDLEIPSASQNEGDIEMDTGVPTQPAGEEIAQGQSSSYTQESICADMLDVPESTATKGQSSSSIPNRGMIPLEQIPPIDEQISVVTKMCEVFNNDVLAPGAKTYIMSTKWLGRVQARGSTAKIDKKTASESDVGPIDNSDIIHEILTDFEGQQFVRLKPDLPSQAFTYFPEDAWEYVLKLYGLTSGQIPIIRTSLNTNSDPFGIPNVQFELNPVVFIVYRLWGAHSPIPIPQILKAKPPIPPIFFVSRGNIYMDFLKKIKRAVMIDNSQKVRVWRVANGLPESGSLSATLPNATSPAASREGSPSDQIPKTWTKVLVDVTAFNKLEKGSERELVETQDQTNNPNYNGHSTLSMAGLGMDQALVLDELVEGSDYLSQYVSRSSKVTATRADTSSTPLIKSGTVSGRNSPAPSGPMTRGRTQKSSRTIGTVGLTNLGNTCYMNSALQCIRSVPELTKYFLSHEAQRELNPDNPLGNNGDVALVYGQLLEDIYRDPPPSAFTPRQFKNTIGRYAPSFSGYGQQDSQEFLGFLLDGLQEDLSRVKKKPYIEKPDSTDEMIGNPQAIREMAEKVWDITKKRDDSVIADLFTGMYKSTLVCPVCDKVSITFDPFNNLTLQLPVENTWSHDVTFFPMNEKPITISVDMDKQGSVKYMKEFISSRVHVPIERLFAAEEFKHRFFKYLDDMRPVSEEIGSSDKIFVYELESVPTNWPQAMKPVKRQTPILSFGNDAVIDEDELSNWESPLAERMLVPVLQRHPNSRNNNRFGNSWEHGPVPLFIILTPEDARSEDAIKRKILEKITTLTTYSFPRDDMSEEGYVEPTDPDLVVTNSSDADSSGDSKVAANSVDGEEDVVDITMKDSSTGQGQKEANAENSKESIGIQGDKPQQKQRFKMQRPNWLDSSEQLPPEFQNIFELGYFSGKKELVPTGWGVGEDASYPRLSTREPPLQQESEDGSQDDDMTNGLQKTESEDSDEDEDVASLAPTRMNDESSDEDDEDLAQPKPISRAIPVRPRHPRSGVRVGYGRRRNRGIKTYSRKGSKPSQYQEDISETTESSADDGPLIRPGEGIVVDWNPQAYEAMFEGQANDTMRGMPTYDKPEKLDDPELSAKRKARQTRRKQGLTLDECLDEFGKEEILSEMDTWYCPRCKEHRRASKKFELWKTPDILVIHLKRFSSSSHRRDKLEIFVDFPIEGLDLSNRVVDHQDGKQEVFDLFAVDDHWGGLGGGHYTAYAKSFIDNEWYEYNDSSVSKQKDASRAVSSAAYLLFYRRRSNEPLGGPRLKEIVHNYDNPPEPEISEDESAESGEDQRLGADSSQHGSSSALIGVGAVHLPAGGLGNARRTNPANLENPPPYKDHIKDENVAPLLANDAVMNDGIEMEEEDEGIDMGLGYNSFNNNSFTTKYAIPGSWNFSALDNLGGTTGSKMSNEDSIDGASDVVQHDSSASEETMDERLQEFENAEVESGEWVEPSPVPDLAEEDQMDIYNLHGTLLGTARRHGDEVVRELQVPAPVGGDDEDLEEEAAEIRVEDGDGLKME